MGTDKMQVISNAIKEGAEAFVTSERTIILFSSVLAVLIFLLYAFVRTKSADPRRRRANGFLDYVLLCARRLMFSHRRLRRHVGVDPRQYSNGGGGSIEPERGAEDRDAGWGGVRAFCRGDELAGSRRSLRLAGLFGTRSAKDSLYDRGLRFGASFVALFAQLGGGIYTKAADVGAIWSARSKQESQKMIHATRRLLQISSAMWVIAPVAELTCSNPRRRKISVL